MGLPDSWTRWNADGSENKDSPRYRWVGDGAAAPVLEWIGRRLLAAMSSAASSTATARNGTAAGLASGGGIG